MKLKTAARIETSVRVVMFILNLPFEIIRQILKWTFTLLIWPFEKLLDWNIYICWKIGNRLFKKSDEVISGQIKNQNIIKSETARRANILWENENKKYLNGTS